MGTTKIAGFTILETMLFLAITGVLIMALLSGVGVSINTQRYRDSVQSFKSLIQNQYTQLLDVQNAVTPKDNSWTCNGSGEVKQNAGPGTYPGQSDCVLLGRYIVINQGKVSTQSITGFQSGTNTTGNDIDSLVNNYKLSLTTSDIENRTLDWGTAISWPIAGTDAKPAGTPRSLGILLVRSPDSGAVYTFTIDSPPDIAATDGAALAAMLVTGDTVSKTFNNAVLRGQDQRIICIDAGGLVTGGVQAVVINAYATNATGVETRSNDILLQLDKASGTQC